MKISVITVTFNAAGFIEDCLRSVAEQTYSDVEHIVVDGLSNDATVAIAGRYSHLTRLISEPDDGIYDAMNKGLDFVTGDYVLFLNADDRFASATSLEKAVAAIEADPGADVYYGSLEVRPLDGPVEVFHPPPPADVPAFMVCGCLPHQSTLARASVFVRTGKFDLRYRCHADYDWFLKVLADPAIDVRSVNAVIGSFRAGGASSDLAKHQPEAYKIQNQSPLYATPEWDKRRIETLQEAFLRERLTSAQLREDLRALRQRERRLANGKWPRATGAGWSVVDIWRAMMEKVKRALTASGNPLASLPQRLRWRTLNTCVRVLPGGVVDTLRRVRPWVHALWGRSLTINASGQRGAGTRVHRTGGAPDGPGDRKTRGRHEYIDPVVAKLD